MKNEDWEQDTDEWGQEELNQQVEIGSFKEGPQQVLNAANSYNNGITAFSMKEIMQKMLTNKIRRANDLLCFDNEDDVIKVLRHFDWNESKMEEKWFDQQDKLVYDIGIKFDSKLLK